jgi:hypothetical protein
MAQVNFRFISNTKGLQDGIKRSKKSLSGFESATKKISSGIGKALGGIGLALGVGALVNGLKEATKAAAEDAREQRILAQQLRTTLGATKEQIAGTEEYIAKLSLQTGLLDSDLRPALANAVRGTGNLGDAQKLLEIALDGAAASGKSVDTVMAALIKANNGNTTSLYRLAPELKKTKGNIDDYAKSVEGAAEVSADPFARLNVATKELQEQLGNILLPYVIKFAEYMMENVVPAVQTFFDEINDPKTEAGKVFKDVKGIVKDIFDLLGKIGRSKEFKLALEGALGVARLLLDALLAIDNILKDSKANDAARSNATGFTQKNKQGLLTDANIQAAAGRLGRTLTGAEIKRARADLSGGADGNPMTPWPFAKGGIVMPRPGGTLGVIGEAGKPEAVIPLDRMGDMFGGNTYIININKAAITGQEIVTAIQRYERGSGRKVLLNG